MSRARMTLFAWAVASVIPLAAGAQTAPAAGAATPETPPPPGGSSSTAATATPPAGGEQDMQATVHTENGRRVYVASTTIEVRGEIQRPYAFSVSGRSSLGYTYFQTPVHFVQDILDAVRRSPF